MKLSERLESREASGVEELKVVENIVAAASGTRPLELFILVWKLLDPRAKINPMLVGRAIEGDLTSAEQLHQAVVPEWYFTIGSEGGDDGEIVFYVIIEGGYDLYPNKVYGSSPARAWVTAIVKIKEEE